MTIKRSSMIISIFDIHKSLDIISKKYPIFSHKIIQFILKNIYPINDLSIIAFNATNSMSDIFNNYTYPCINDLQIYHYHNCYYLLICVATSIYLNHYHLNIKIIDHLHKNPIISNAWSSNNHWEYLQRMQFRKYYCSINGCCLMIDFEDLHE